jgi:hypothetical protein
MFTPEPGVEPMDLVERMEGKTAAPPDPEGEARAGRLADALTAVEPRYARSELELEGTRAIELVAQDSIQITLWPDHASFNFPYWDSLDAGQLIADIDQASRIIAAETGWQLYDPQLEKFMDPERDAAEFGEAFGVGVSHLQRITSERAEEPASSERPSFWRRLFGRG